MTDPHVTASTDELEFAAHYCRGRLPVAFIFSVPGAEEKDQQKPLAGETGRNLERALVHLRSKKPDVFASLDRYQYRITNAFAEPIARSLGHRASEAKKSQIMDETNIQRVVREVEGCHVVILCGDKAQLLGDRVKKSGRIVVSAPHVGNSGLNRAFRNNELVGFNSPRARSDRRIEKWACGVIRALDTALRGQ